MEIMLSALLINASSQCFNQSNLTLPSWKIKEDRKDLDFLHLPLSGDL
jgi:hypothetical protein